MANHLVIGLGGTGGSVLRALRKRIYEEFRSNEPAGDAHIEYLYVDSSLADLNNESDWQTLGVSVQLSPAQRFLFLDGDLDDVGKKLEWCLGGLVCNLQREKGEEAVMFHLCADLRDKQYLSVARRALAHFGDKREHMFKYNYHKIRFYIHISRTMPMWELQEALTEFKKEWDETVFCQYVYLYNTDNTFEPERQKGVASAGDFLFQRILLNWKNWNKYEEWMWMTALDEVGRPSRFYCIVFGLKRIEYPELEIKEYVAFRLVSQVIRRMLDGKKMTGKIEKRIEDQGEIERNLLSEEYLTLSKSLPSMQAFRWKSITQTWEECMSYLKRDVEVRCNGRKERCSTLDLYVDKYFAEKYRNCGVRTFYVEEEKYIGIYAREICNQIEQNAYSYWKCGSMSLLEVQTYVKGLISQCERRMANFSHKIKEREIYMNESIQQELQRFSGFYPSWLIDVIRLGWNYAWNCFVKAKKQQMILQTEIVGYWYAIKLLGEVSRELIRLDEQIGRLVEKLDDEVARMEYLADMRCKSGIKDTQQVYNPEQVRIVVQELGQNQILQDQYVFQLRNGLVHLSEASCFRELEECTYGNKWQEFLYRESIKIACDEMERYTKLHSDTPWGLINLLDRLHNGACDTLEKRRRFVCDFCREAIRRFPSKYPGNYRNVFLYLPRSCDDERFRDEFIRDVECNADRPGVGIFVSESLKSNQIILIVNEFFSDLKRLA